MKTKTIIAMAVTVLSSLCFAEEAIISPELDVVGHRVFQENANVYRVDFDFNADGWIDQLITSTDLLNGKAGNIWKIYLQNDNKQYSPLKDLISFSPECFYAGELAPLKEVFNTVGVKIEDYGSTVGLVTSIGGGGGRGVLLLHQLVEGKIKTIHLKNNYTPKFDDKDATIRDFLLGFAAFEAKVIKKPLIYYAPMIPLRTTVNRKDFINKSNKEVVSYTPDNKGGFTTETMVMPTVETPK